MPCLRLRNTGFAQDNSGQDLPGEPFKAISRRTYVTPWHQDFEADTCMLANQSRPSPHFSSSPISWSNLSGMSGAASFPHSGRRYVPQQIAGTCAVAQRAHANRVCMFRVSVAGASVARHDDRHEDRANAAQPEKTATMSRVRRCSGAAAFWSCAVFCTYFHIQIRNTFVYAATSMVPFLRRGK